MMECIFVLVAGIVLGFVLGRIPQNPKKAQKEPTAEEKRRAEKSWREYFNFMNYDGFPQDEE